MNQAGITNNLRRDHHEEVTSVRCAVFCTFTFITTTASAVILPLESRLGGLAYYDPNLDITWAADTNINGLMDWDTASAWVAGLSIGGVSGWRLPSADVNGNGHIADCVTGLSDICSDSEMAYLYYMEGISASNPGPFNIPFNPNGNASHWSGTEFDVDEAWDFIFVSGGTSIGQKSADNYAWSVHGGDVSAVPIPPPLWLFGSGLLGLIGIARKKAA